MKNTVTIAAIVSLYNPSDKDIDRLNMMIPHIEKLFVLDDSETPLRREYVEMISNNHNVEYEWNGGNVGLCKSLNIGIVKAIKYGADWILFMDSDSCFYNDILSIYLEKIGKIGKEKIALLSPRYNYDRHKRKPQKGYRRKKLAMLSGGLINVEAIQSIGSFDERFFIDGLDYEWCLRAIRSGYQIIECSEAMINHHPAETKELRFCGKTVFRYGWDKPSRYYYQFRASRIIHEEYHCLYIDLFCMYKYLKALLLFDNTNAYVNAWKNAKRDYESGYFGKYEDN